MTPCFLNSKFASLPVGQNISLVKGPRYFLSPQLGSVGSKVLKRLYGRNHGKLQPWCCVVSRHVFTQLVQTEVRAELLHFHFQPSEMPVVQKKKVCQARWRQQPEQLVQFPAPSSPVESCGCSASDSAAFMWPKQWQPEAAKSFPGQGLLAYPTLWTGRGRWIAACPGVRVMGREGWVWPESASIRGLA